MKQKISITIDERLLREVDAIVDNVFIRNRSRAIEYLIEKTMHESRTAVILLGGPAEELRMADGKFRPTAKIDEHTVIEHALQKLRSQGFKKVYIVAEKPVLVDLFEIVGNGSQFGVEVEYTEDQRGDGSAASLSMLKHLKHQFLVVYGDLLFDDVNIDRLWKTHIKNKGVCTLLVTASPIINAAYPGMVVMDVDRIKEFHENPKELKSTLFYAGIFVADPQIFQYSGDSLEEEVFPVMARKQTLRGYLSSQKILHFHTIKEFEDLKKHFR